MPHLMCLFHCGRQKRDNTSAIKMLRQMSVWVVVVALGLVLSKRKLKANPGPEGASKSQGNTRNAFFQCQWLTTQGPYSEPLLGPPFKVVTWSGYTRDRLRTSDSTKELLRGCPAHTAQ